MTKGKEPQVEIGPNGQITAQSPVRRNMPIGIRQIQPLEVESIDTVPARYFALALVELKKQMASIAKMVKDHSRPVDEYNPQSLAPESGMSLTLQPQWEVGEVIESIVINGPPAGAVTLQLGDRVWSLIIPASGILVMSPVKVILSRSDIRMLVAAVPGEYFLELMGFCDDRT